MNKRQFLGSAALAAALPATAAPAAAFASKGPTLLTISGAIGKANRSQFDPVLDQMLKKHKVRFEQALALDFTALTALPAVTIKPTLEYDARAHALRGPLLVEVLALAGAKLGDQTALALRAVDGYVASISVAQARSQRFIIATHLDGQPMGLGGLGPLWAIIDADRIADLATRPLAERFGACPWALYHIDVAG